MIYLHTEFFLNKIWSDIYVVFKYLGLFTFISFPSGNHKTCQLLLILFVKKVIKKSDDYILKWMSKLTSATSKTYTLTPRMSNLIKVEVRLSIKRFTMRSKEIRIQWGCLTIFWSLVVSERLIRCTVISRPIRGTETKASSQDMLLVAQSGRSSLFLRQNVTKN